jgi:hypothetical protein
MARIYANENVALPVVEELRLLGHDVLTTLDAGNAGRAIPDEEVLAYATAEMRIVLTINRRHFLRFHQSQPKHAGIIVCTFDRDFAGQAGRIHSALVGKSSYSGELLRVNRPS